MKSFVKRIREGEFYSILKIQSCIIRNIIEFMYKNEVLQLMPVILSPETDPLCHSTFEAIIDYYGQNLKLTKSMILHKQIALIPEKLSKIFILSPNVRLEKEELAKTGRHLIEFTQLDIEFKDKTKYQFMKFIEDLVIEIIKTVKQNCKGELKALDRNLTIPSKPFKVYESQELKEKYGGDFERIISEKSKEPFWVLNHKREFYDREDEKKDYYHNYDLVWPEGFGEALSGGERELEHKEILRKMNERQVDTKAYKQFLELAKLKLLQKSAGGGLGIERLVRFIIGVKDIKDVTLFPRTPGEKIII